MARAVRSPRIPLGCVACTRPPGAGYALCPSCCDRLADHLAAFGELSRELDVTAARWDVLYVVSGRGGEDGLPYAQEATDSKRALHATLIHWARQVALTRDTLWSLPETMAELVAWLAYRLDWLRMMESSGDAYAQIDAVVGRVRRAIDRPTNRTTFPVGSCPETIGTHLCPGMVFAYIPIRIGIEPAVLRCRNPQCVRHTNPWPPEEWRSAGRRIHHRKVVLAYRGTGCSAR